MKPSPLPPHYQQVDYLRVSTSLKNWRLHLIALGLMLGGIGGFGGLIAWYYAIGAPFILVQNTTDFSAVSVSLGLSLLLFVFPLHEWLHGQILRYYGFSPRYGRKRLALFATADDAYLERNQFLAFILMPVISICGGACLLCLVLPFNLALWLVMSAAANLGGSVSDLWMAQRALKFPKWALICDEEDAMRVFMPK